MRVNRSTTYFTIEKKSKSKTFENKKLSHAKSRIASISSIPSAKRIDAGWNADEHINKKKEKNNCFPKWVIITCTAIRTRARSISQCITYQKKKKFHSIVARKHRKQLHCRHYDIDHRRRFVTAQTVTDAADLEKKRMHLLGKRQAFDRQNHPRSDPAGDFHNRGVFEFGNRLPYYNIGNNYRERSIDSGVLSAEGPSVSKCSNRRF